MNSLVDLGCKKCIFLNVVLMYLSYQYLSIINNNTYVVMYNILLLI